MQKSSTSTDETDAVSLKSIYISINNNHKEISHKIDNVAAELSNKIAEVKDDLYKKIDNVDAKLEGRCDHLENRMTITEISLERYKKLGAYIVYGIPIEESEDLYSIFQSICSKIQVNLNVNSSTISAFRIGNKSRSGKPPAVLLKCLDRSASTPFFTAYRSKSPPLTTSDIGFSTNNRIFINHSLTHHDQKIHQKCLELKSKKLLSQVNIDEGVISIKLDRQSKKVRISSLADLNTLQHSIENNVTSLTPLTHTNIKNRNFVSNKRKPTSPPSLTHPTKSANSNGTE